MVWLRSIVSNNKQLGIRPRNNEKMEVMKWDPVSEYCYRCDRMPHHLLTTLFPQSSRCPCIRRKRNIAVLAGDVYCDMRKK
jgi:hypothetical protein